MLEAAYKATIAEDPEAVTLYAEVRPATPRPWKPKPRPALEVPYYPEGFQEPPARQTKPVRSRAPAARKPEITPTPAAGYPSRSSLGEDLCIEDFPGLLEHAKQYTSRDRQ